MDMDSFGPRFRAQRVTGVATTKAKRKPVDSQLTLVSLV